MSRRTYLRNAFETTLNGGINNSQTTITLTSTTGLTADGWLCIDPDSPTKREYIKFDAISVNDLTGCTRGGAGSAGGAQAHNDGTVVRAVMVHQVVDDLFQDIEDLEANEVTGGNAHDHAGGDGAQIDHGGLGGLADDDHSIYHTDARATTWHDADDHSGLTVDHGATSGLGDDDHTQYLTVARHDTQHDAILGRRITSAQNLPNDTSTTVIFNSVIQDDGTFNLNTGTGVMSIPSGWVFLHASVEMDDDFTGIVHWQLVAHGATVTTAQMTGDAPAGFADTVHLQALVYSGSSGTAYVSAYHESGNFIDVGPVASTRFGAFVVRNV